MSGYVVVRKEFPLENMEKSTKRSLTPDVSRGIAIFLVIWGHVIQQGLYGIAEVAENVVFKWIYTFHMPSFLLISGFFFYSSVKKKNLKTLVLNRTGDLIKTLVIWNTVCYGCKLLFLILREESVTVSVRVWLEEVVMGYWFLWAVLFCAAIVGLVTKVLPQKLWLVGMIVLAPLVLLSPCRWVILSMYPYFVIGFFFHKFIDGGRKIASLLKYVVIVLYVVGMLYYFCVPAVGNSEIKNLLDTCIAMIKGQGSVSDVIYQVFRTALFYYLGITGGITAIVLIDWLGRKVGETGVVWIFAQMGQYSMQIYILQRVFVEIILANVYRSVTEHMGTGFVERNLFMVAYVYSLFVSVLCAGVIFVIARYGIRGKLRKVLFGR